MGNSFVFFFTYHGNGAVSPWGNWSHTKRCFPMGNSHLPLGKIISVTPFMTMIIEPEGAKIFLTQWKISKNRSLRIYRIASLACNSV